MNSIVLTLISVTALAQVPPPPPEMPAPEQDWAQPAFQDDQGRDEAPVAEDAEPVEMTTVASVQAFEPALAPYGDWVSTNGVRAFRPSMTVVGQNFQPYTSHGRWVSTEAGWSFSSTLPFGWATFHYGRWWLDPTYGWVWVPDTIWGPSWVDWRYGGGYTGWAPLPPPMFRAYYRPRWFFVGAPYFCSRDLYRYAVPPHRYDSVFSVTVGVPVRTWRGNTWYSGPAYREIAHVAVEPPVRRSMVTFTPPPSFHGTVNVGAGYRGVPPPAQSHAMAPPPPGSGGLLPPVPRSPSPPPPTSGFMPPAHGSAPPPGGGFIPPPAPRPPSGGVVTPGGARSFGPPPMPSAQPQPSYRAPPPAPSFRAPPAPSRAAPPPAPHFSAPPPPRSFSGGNHGGGHRR